jgi:hypothetical protein
MGKKSASGYGIRDEQPGSYFLEFGNHFFGVKILKFFDADPGWRQFGSGMGKSRILDKHPGSATMGINIPDPLHWSSVYVRWQAGYIEK